MFFDSSILLFIKLFIEARDTRNPFIRPAYTTIQINVNLTYSYFTDPTGSGALTLYMDQRIPVNQSIYDMSSIIYQPGNVYVYNDGSCGEIFFLLKLNFKYVSFSLSI